MYKHKSGTVKLNFDDEERLKAIMSDQVKILKLNSVFEFTLFIRQMVIQQGSLSHLCFLLNNLLLNAVSCSTQGKLSVLYITEFTACERFLVVFENM